MKCMHACNAMQQNCNPQNIIGHVLILDRLRKTYSLNPATRKGKERKGEETKFNDTVLPRW